MKGDSVSIIEKFSELHDIIERNGLTMDSKKRDDIEFKIAELLASLGLIEEKTGGYKLTELGKKFFELSVE